MKILIAYDGSECSDAAIIDLKRAGLPAVAEALVFSVAEMTPLAVAAPYCALGAGAGIFVPEAIEAEPCSEKSMNEARSYAVHAADRLRADFPGWQVRTESWIDEAGPAIIRKAHAWNPDLMVVGSHGHAGIGRFVLGSVSQQVLHHVAASVRISRHRLLSQQRPIRLLIGVDGSADANLAVKSIIARNWPAGTEARVVGVLESHLWSAAGTEDARRDGLSQELHQAVKALTKCGLRATPQVLAGKPSEILLAEADKWAVDCIFVGARGLNGFERVMLGSVSTAVASHAQCSVEIVRPQMA